MDWIFKIGIFMLPFENLFFAPSTGWATITPIIFAIYILFNIKLAFKSLYKYRYILVFFAFGILISCLNYIYIGVELKNLINALISLGLGITNLICFDIYFSQKKHSINNIVKIILISYGISLLIGWVQFISARLDIIYIKDLFILLEKRAYIKYNRIQFTFTEPSFIGMHLFGILLPMFICTKKKSILAMIIAFAVSAILFSSGVRILIDIIVVIGICYLIYFIKNIKSKKVVFRTIAIILLGIVTIITLYNTNYRVRSILNKGIYADGSLASRFFRINSSVKGYMKDKVNFAFGYGIGNSIIPMRNGYEEAIAEYKSDYTKEMEELADPNFTNDSVNYCLYTRFTSEFGIIALIIAMIYMFRLSRKSKDIFMKNYIFILLYLYIQFESYAFYTIWLYIVLLQVEKEKREIEDYNKEINSNDLVSIIVPVYNVEKYLKQCIESLINQTYKNIEIILVEDGSKDSSPKICNRYAKKDTRVKVIHQKNSGVSEARNKGIDQSKGEWITFVDADDYIAPDFCQKMLAIALQTESQCVICAYNKIYSNNTVEILKNENLQLNREEFLEKIFDVQSGFGFCHMKLWNARIIKENKIRFNKELKVAEDALFCITMSDYINNIYFLNQALYNYRINSESTVRKFDENYTKKYLSAMIKTKDYIIKNKKEEIRFYNYVAYHVLLIVINYCFHPENEKKGIQLLKEICEIPEFKEAIEYSNYEGFSFTRKATLFTLKHKLYIITSIIAKIRQHQLKR